MNGRARTVLAVLGAVLYPGVGHAILGAWRRGLAWFGLSFLTAYAALLLADVPVEDLETLQAAVELQTMLPWQATAAILFLSALNVADVYWLATRGSEAGADGGTDGESGATCPECGRDLDEDLDFCPWCTARLDATSR